MKYIFELYVAWTFLWRGYEIVAENLSGHLIFMVYLFLENISLSNAKLSFSIIDCHIETDIYISISYI